MLITKTKYSENFLLYIFLSVLGVIYLVHALYFPGSFQGADGLRHYQISRYSWTYPYLLLDHWGKPFFTLISSLFSQFGLIGIKFFNIVCALLSCHCVFNIAKKLEMKNSLLAPIFLGFTTIYFFMAISGYTELLFGLILVFSIQLLINQKYFFASLLISFLPFVRSEGYLLLPLFCIVLLLRKKYFYMPLLATGILVYSILGYFVFDDLFWLNTQNPYNGNASIMYGHGPLLHFINSYSLIWGLPLATLTLFGLICVFKNIFRRKQSHNSHSIFEIFLIYGSFLIYFCAHSVFWWKGLFNSLGLERVMGAILPVSALISLRGFNYIFSFLKRFKLISKMFLLLTIFFVIITPFQNYYFPLTLDGEEKLILAVKQWYNNSEFRNKNLKYYYLHPYFPEAFAFDSFNKTKCGELWEINGAISNSGYSAIPDSSLVFWDSHFGANEGNMPLKKIMSDSNFRLIKKFSPKNSFYVLGNQLYEIYVFQKIKPKVGFVSLSSLKFYDFESTAGLENTVTFSIDRAFSGKHSCLLNSSREYSTTIVEKTNSISNIGNTNFVKFTFMLWGEGIIEASAVMSFHKNNTQMSYYTFPIKFNFSEKKDWVPLSIDWSIDPDSLKKSDYIKIYILNNLKQTFYVDDFKVEFLNKYY